METPTATHPATRRHSRRTTTHVLRRLTAAAVFSLAVVNATVETAAEPGEFLTDFGVDVDR